MARSGLGHVRGDENLETAVLGQSQYLIDRMGFAPPHEIIPAKTRITTHDNPDLGPHRPQPPDNALQFRFGTGRCVLIGATQTGT
jgi:hypothetical protein